MGILALFAVALIGGMSQVGSKLIEKGVIDPLLEPATELLKKWLQRPYQDPEKDKALQDAIPAAEPIQRALERSGHDAICLLSQAVMLWQENRRDAALESLARAQKRDRSITRLDDLRYEHFWRTTALTALQEMLKAQTNQERSTDD